MSKVISKNLQKHLRSILVTSLILGTTFFGLVACDKANASATKVDVNIYKLVPGKPSNDENNLIGTISFTENKFGLLITPNLKNITPGAHGFHLHNNANCDPVVDNGSTALGMAAGDHYDPGTSNKHSGPFTAEGHLGDLPVLQADQNGNANTTLLAPRLKLSDLKGRSVMIHAGADNYSDNPKAGGGGERKYCGIIVDLK